MGLLSELFADALEDDVLLGGQNAKKTLCCGVRMHDVWIHADTCPQRIASHERYKRWRDANPKAPLSETPSFVPPKGYRDGLCPHCGYPTDHFGIYTVGEKCAYCGFTQKWSFRQQLNDEIARIGLSNREIASVAEVIPSTVARWRSGQSCPLEGVQNFVLNRLAKLPTRSA